MKPPNLATLRYAPRLRLLVAMAVAAAMTAGCQRAVPPNVTPPNVAAKAPAPAAAPPKSSPILERSKP